MPTLLRCVVSLSLAAGAAAQTVHLVGPGGFAQIDDALAVASPGDVVHVQGGAYGSFHGTVGVTIRGIGGAVMVGGATIAVPANEALHLVDLSIGTTVVSAGICTFDRCTITPGSLNGSLYVSDARVDLHECVVGQSGAPYLAPFGGVPGMIATNAAISAVDTQFRGRDRETTFNAPGGAAILLVASTFHGSRVTADGGDGLSTGSGVPGPALSASNATVWLSDSTLNGGRATDLGSAPWRCPVAVTGTTTGRLARCVQDPATCAGGIPTGGPMLGVHRASPLPSGALLQLDFQTEPNGFVGVFASFGLASLTLFELEQPIALDLATLFPFAVLAADGSGAASGAWMLPPNVADYAVWFQGAAAPAPVPLQISPVTGGVLR